MKSSQSKTHLTSPHYSSNFAFAVDSYCMVPYIAVNLSFTHNHDFSIHPLPKTEFLSVVQDSLYLNRKIDCMPARFYGIGF